MKKFTLALAALVTFSALPAQAAIKNIPFGADSEFMRLKINEVLVGFKEQYSSLNAAPTHLWSLQCGTVSAVQKGRGLPANAAGVYACEAVTDLRNRALPAFNADDTVRVVNILVNQAGVSFKRNDKDQFITPLLYISCRNFTDVPGGYGCVVEPNRFKP